MSIHFQNDRPAYTVLPDLVDEATGERVEDTGMLCETHLTSLIKKDQSLLLDPETEYEENIIELTPEEAVDAGLETTDGFISNDDLDPTVLAEVSDEIHQSEFAPDEAVAAAVVSVPMSDTPADITVQYLAHQVYSGNITPEEAFEDALLSGINHAELIRSYDYLKSHFE